MNGALVIRIPFVGRLLCWLGFHSEEMHDLGDSPGRDRTLHRCNRCGNSRITTYCWADGRY